MLTSSSPSTSRTEFTPDTSHVSVSCRLDSGSSTAPNQVPFLPMRSHRPPLPFPTESPFLFAPRPTNFFVGAPPIRRRASPFPASTVRPRARDHAQYLSLVEVHLPDLPVCYSPQLIDGCILGRISPAP